ncbi:hypothetical protein A1A1_18342 [Planococcus antarcticus DSM 14505]|uniref:Uncharacterized protein n=1 Tax=Planococcus antarcticus DSM 14505 TaxID=1185653 RepID=A0AA87IH12_9BACL|nr:hypothetical protein [Planococcus antarcticus]EIM05015.1 hypothetical protein A1A1_18342 [Planococcus antarcticus DSM 14505]
MKIHSYLPYILIVSILLTDFIIYGGLINMFFEDKETIIAGVIAFFGAIIGGVITYLGVNKTLKHRDKELFLNSATEKLMLLEILIDTYKGSLNQMLFAEIYLDKKADTSQVNKVILSEAKEFVERLKNDKEKMYKSMEYEQIQIITFHQKTLEGLTRKNIYTDEDARESIEKIRSVFHSFDLSKKELESKYYLYRNS